MRVLTTIATFISAALLSTAAQADGELHIYTWGNYTPPKLIEKFEKEYNVKVTIDGYDNNETMYAKIKSGATGYDLVVPTDYMVGIMIREGMLQEVDVDQFSNFKNLNPDWVNVYWDPGRKYSVPWQWGTTAYSINTAKYSGEANSLKLLFDPPAELSGHINMLDDMNEVINAGLRYLGYDRCNSNKDQLRALMKLLMNAKQHWRTIDLASIEKMTSGDVIISQNWNGASMRARRTLSTVKYVYPKEGMTGWMDNVAVLKGAPDLENAKKFLNFMLEPENAALVSDFDGYANGIIGGEKFMDPSMKDAPEIVMPADAPKPDFVKPCDQAVVANYTKIWAELKK